MHHKKKHLVTGLTTAALALGIGSSLAVAAGTNGPGGPGGPGGGPASQAVATYLGLSQADLLTQLQAGKTLAQVATAQGKTASGLEDAILTDAKTHLDADVTAGKLTAAQETTMLDNLKSHVADIVNSTGPAGGKHGPGGPGGPGGTGGPGGNGGPASQAAATYLGLSQADLRTQLQAGKTLAQVATAQGKTASGLEDAILTDAKTHLDADVTAGKLTAAQETTMLDNLKSHVADIVNSTGPAGGKGGPGGPPSSSGAAGSGSIN